MAGMTYEELGVVGDGVTEDDDAVVLRVEDAELDMGVNPEVLRQ